MKDFLRHFLILANTCIPFILFSQNGPGGIGDGSGTTGPRNVLWLDASSLGLGDGANVTTWADLSGNGNDLTQQGADAVPTFAVDAFGTGLDAVRFDGTERYLRIVDNASLDGFSGGVSIITVVDFGTVDNNPRGIISKRTSSSSEQAYSIFTWTGSVLTFDTYVTGNNRLSSGTALSASTDYILSSIYDGTNQYISVSGAAPSTQAVTGSVADATSDLIIGALNNNYGTYFDGDLAEVIIYGDGLTQAQRVIIENYLGDKYSITITNDLWSNNATYSNDLAGIGQESLYSSEATSAASSVIRIMESNDFDDDDWLFWGHDSGDISTWDNSGTEVPGTEERLGREWLIEETGNVGQVTVSVNESDLPATGVSNPQFYLLVDTDGDADFSNATAYAMVPDGSGGASVNVDLNTNDRIAISFTPGQSSQIWYSYLSGDWSNPNTWTLDGAISPLYVNPSSEVPGIQDSVVINSGRTVTIDINDVAATRVEIVGTLDIAGTSGHAFGILDGSGTLRLSGSGGLNNYPTTNDALFTDPDEGGTLEIYGTGLSINSNQDANDLIINMTNPTDVLTAMADIDVNGNLTISNGIFQFNDNSATQSVNVTVDGNVLIESSGGIDVGTANARHEFNLYGDFTNQGDVDFTNRTSQIAGSEATDGIVDVNFLSSNTDQIVDLQNTTDFYRIEINKGVDDTYMLDITADDPNYFNLYGYAGQSMSNAAQQANNNALGLVYGTVKIGSNVNVANLTSGTNYNINEGARIWVDGGTVAKPSGTAIVPYGELKVTSGSVSAPISSGITVRDNGRLIIEGGTVTVNQFRTSINGVSAEGGLTMTGGVFNITGGSTSTDYYTFSLTYEGNVFVMSGGIINLSGVNTTGGIYINSSVENVNVTGGTINLDVSNNNNLTITSSAPFFNTSLSRSSGNGSLIITSGSSGTGGGQTTYNPTELTILNDLTIDNSDATGTVFNSNGIDVSVTGSLIVDAGSVVDFSGSNVIFEGVGSSNIDIGLASTLLLDSLEINKENELVNVNIINGQATALQVAEYLNVESGNLNLGTFDITANGNLYLSDTIGNSTSTGQVYMNGGGTQTITSSKGAIYDLEIDNVNGVSLSGHFGIINQLDLNSGVFDINTFKLTTGSEVATTGTFGTTLMIQTNGNASDGGLEVYIDGSNTYLFPIGTDANATVRYTPAEVDISTNYSDDGYIQIRPADTELATLRSVGTALTYYWRVSHRNFTNTTDLITQYRFTYDNSDTDDGTQLGGPDNHYPGYSLDENPYTIVRLDDEVDGTNVIVFDGNQATVDGSNVAGSVQDFDLANANYTAATTNSFNTSVEVYYSYVPNGSWVNWESSSNWSTVSHTDPTNTGTAGGYPQAGDVAIIGSTYSGGGTGRHQFRSETNSDITIAALVFDSQSGGTAFNVTDMSRLRIRAGRTLTVGSVTGTGEMVQDIGTAPQTATIVGDFGEFLAEKNNGWFFWFQSATDVTITDRFEYPIFRLFGANGTLNFSQDVTAHGVVIDSDTELRVTTNYTLDSLVQIGSNQSGTLAFRDVGTNLTFECGSIVFSNDANNSVTVETTGTDIHRLIVNEGIDLDVGTGFDLSSPAGTQVSLELAGEGQHTFENTTGTVPDLYRIILNKGSDTTSTFTMNTDFTLSGSNTVAPQSIYFQNGKLILNDVAINVELADNSNLTIPATSGLELTQGTVTTTGAVVKLSGLLRLNGGTATFSSSDIEYSNTGTSLIDISSGTLNVGGQIRRSTSSTTGVLKYRQTGGDVDIATDGISTPTRSVFEVLNAGSEFILTGGTFNLERGVTGDANKSFELNPETYDVSGSTITIFENLGTNYGSSYFNLSSAIPLNNLSIVNTINLPDVRLYNRDLEVNDLTINSNQALIANGFDLAIDGNFTNEGTYTNLTAETILEGNGSQLISGSGTFNIYTLRKSGTGAATSSVSLNLLNDFYLTGGSFDVGSNSLSLQNDAYIESTFANTGGNGLVFNGTANQDLNGLSNNTINIGTITISNPSGVDIPDGNGFNFDITQELRLNGGVFNIGGSLVTLVAGAPVTAVSAFNVNNMVQTNSSFTDNGLRIAFFDVAADTVVFFPIGELKYTPVEFNLDAGTTAGSIRVRPANERHPTIVDDAEPVTESEIDDTQNVLQYHWIVVAESLTNASGTAIFHYKHADVLVTAPYDTTHYISGRLLANDVNWDKYDPTLFWGGNETFRIPLSAFTASEITGDYTAGVGSSDGINNDIEGAIPDQIAQYETSLAGSGNYSASASWNPLNGSPAVSNGIGPVGAQIIIRSGDDLTLDISNIRLYSTEIEAGGILRVPTGIVGIRLGIVTGQGTIVLEDTELLPTGEYSDFFACDGGALQYAGTTNYSVLSGISQIRKVVFDGTGTRTMPNNNLFVCDTLLINGPTVAFNSGRTRTIGNADTDRLEIQAGTITLSNGTVLDVAGDFIMSGGTLTGSNGTSIQITDDVNYSGGTINWNGTNVLFDGASSQLISGAFTGVSSFDNLTLNNTSSSGVTISSGDIEVDGILTLTDGYFNTTTSETLTLSSSGSWIGASSASYIIGPLTKENIPVSSTFRFPVGKSARYAPVSVVNVGTGGDDWTAEYFTTTNPTYDNGTFDSSDPGSGFNALIRVQSTDRWQVSSATSNSAQIRAMYGSHNGFENSASIRLVWWDDEPTLDGDAAQNRWENQGGQVAGTNVTGTVTSENTIVFSTRQIALGYAPESILPVELLYFDGEAENNKVMLSWETATEINNDYFEVQRSADGIVFESIGKVQGNGNSNSPIDYSFIDSKPYLGLGYYRLRQVDFDGTEELFPIIQVTNDFKFKGIQVFTYPNPTTAENLNVRVITGDDHSPLSLKIVDMAGKSYLETTFNGALVIDEKLEPIKKMTSGIYFMMVEQGRNIQRYKIIIR